MRLPPLLAVDELSVSYGRLRAVRGVSLAVPEGSLVALLGPNGAGKTTLLRAIAGLHPPERGRVAFDGEDVTGLAAHEIARKGLVMLPEGRGIFPSLSVDENLRVWGAGDVAVERFPILAERRSQAAGTLSGGEQQMLALTRTMSGESRLVLLDEPSLALAPRLVAEVFRHVAALRDAGRTVLLVEQYVTRALKLADLVYVMQKGRIVFAGEPDELGAHPVLSGAYLGDVGVEASARRNR